LASELTKANSWPRTSETFLFSSRPRRSGTRTPSFYDEAYLRPLYAATGSLKQSLDLAYDSGETLCLVDGSLYLARGNILYSESPTGSQKTVYVGKTTITALAGDSSGFALLDARGTIYS
jgi:hypothetical protein